MRMQGSARGFSLIELMIALAIVAILAAIALPSYQKSVQKSNRAVAKGLLTQIIAREEAFYADRKSYATTLSAINYAGDTVYALRDGSLITSATDTNAIYSITLTGASATAFTVTATAINSQASDTCTTLTISSTGVKGQSGSLGALCWKS